MAEILLSFFAVIGIVILSLHICDFIFYRNFRQKTALIVDLSTCGQRESIETMELITSVRQFSIGKAAIAWVIILVSDKKSMEATIAEEYMKAFGIPGEIHPKETFAFGFSKSFSSQF